MEGFVEYKLRIIGPSPRTIPMSRLAAYMAEMAKLMGSTDSVHFENIVDSSVGIVARARDEVVPLISPRIRAASTGEESTPATRAWLKINEYLADDGWTAEMPLPNNGIVIQFPGRAKLSKAVRSVNQPTSVQGRLIRIEGAGDTVSVGLEIDGDLTAHVTLPANLAQNLGHHFHATVRLSGEGRWKRDRDGVWSLDRLAASTFEALSDESLVDTLARLKKLFPHGAGETAIHAVDELRSA